MLFNDIRMHRQRHRQAKVTEWVSNSWRTPLQPSQIGLSYITNAFDEYLADLSAREFR